MAVRTAFEAVGLSPVKVELGEVTIADPVNQHDQNRALTKLAHNLEAIGFEIIDDHKSRIIEKIRNIIVKLIHHSHNTQTVNLSTYITDQLHYDYTYLSNLFSATEGLTIERYFISQKIERIKELLTYDELTLSQIADQLGYSSTAYLSNQFKKETGLSPSFFKNLKHKNRRNLDDL
ncbi:MAG: AraC family transcriptional regulator [Niabella sp.]